MSPAAYVIFRVASVRDRPLPAFPSVTVDLSRRCGACRFFAARVRTRTHRRRLYFVNYRRRRLFAASVLRGTAFATSTEIRTPLMHRRRPTTTRVLYPDDPCLGPTRVRSTGRLLFWAETTEWPPPFRCRVWRQRRRCRRSARGRNGGAGTICFCARRCVR